MGSLVGGGDGGGGAGDECVGNLTVGIIIRVQPCFCTFSCFDH